MITCSYLFALSKRRKIAVCTLTNLSTLQRGLLVPD